MSSSVDSTAALNYMSSLANSFQKTVGSGRKISEVCINSIATPYKAFGAKPNFFVRACHWVVGHVIHPKATFFVGKTRITVPTYDPKSNLNEIRRLFRTAIRAEALPKVVSLPGSDKRIEEIIQFALRTDDLDDAKEGVEEETCHQILDEYLSERIQNVASINALNALLDSPIWKQHEAAHKGASIESIEKKIDHFSISKEELSDLCTVYTKIQPSLSPEGEKALVSHAATVLQTCIQEIHDPTKIIDGYKEALIPLLRAGIPLTLQDVDPFVKSLSQQWMVWTQQCAQSWGTLNIQELPSSSQLMDDEFCTLQSRFLSQKTLLEDLFHQCSEPLASKLRARTEAEMAKAQLPLYETLSRMVPHIAESIQTDSPEELHEVELFFKRIVIDMNQLSEVPSKDAYVERTLSTMRQRFESSLSDISSRRKELLERRKAQEKEALFGPSQFSVRGGIYVHAPQSTGPITITVSGMPTASLPTSIPGGSQPSSFSPSSVVRAIAQKVGQVGAQTLNSLQSAAVPALMYSCGTLATTGSLPSAIAAGGSVLFGAAATPLINTAANSIVDVIPVSEPIKEKLKSTSKIATGICLLYLTYRVQSYFSSVVSSYFSKPSENPTAIPGQSTVEKAETPASTHVPANKTEAGIEEQSLGYPPANKIGVQIEKPLPGFPPANKTGVPIEVPPSEYPSANKTGIKIGRVQSSENQPGLGPERESREDWSATAASVSVIALQALTAISVLRKMMIPFFKLL